MTYVSPAKRRSIAVRANFRCEYCLSSEQITSGPYHVEHIWPEALGGSSQLENLAYACPRCNAYKGTRTHFVDPVSSNSVPLFNPRTQSWSRHFAWSSDGIRVVGRTRVGRATVIALNMNELTIMAARSTWVLCDIHPPSKQIKKG